MATKLKNKLILAIGSSATIASVLPVVVSCNDNSIDINNILFENASVISLKSGVVKTVVEFISECGNDTEQILAKFYEYTNLSVIKQDLVLRGIEIDSIEDIKPCSDSVNAIEFDVIFRKGKDKIRKHYILSGFELEATIIDSVIESFKKEVVPILKAKKTSDETSRDVWNIWWSTNSSERTKKLYSYINGLPTSILSNNKFKEANVSVSSEFLNEVEASKTVSWNSSETNMQLKGTILSVCFNFELIEDNSTYKKSLKVNIPGFTSFQSIVDKYANTFKENKGWITTKNVEITPRILTDIFTKSGGDIPYAIDLLSKELANLPQYNTQDSNGVIYNLKSLKQSETDEKAIILTFDVMWEEATKEVSFEIGSLLNDEEFFEKAKEKIEKIELTLVPTKEGALISSKEIVEKFKEDPKSIFNYVSFNNLFEIPYVNVEIKNVSWNETDAIEFWGQTLFLNITFNYANLNDEMSLTPIKGFKMPFLEYQGQFNSFCDSIVVEPVYEKTSLVVADVVNINNWREYITGIPESVDDFDFVVSNISFDLSQADQGNLIMNFVFSWTTPLGNTFQRQFSKVIFGFKAYSSVSAENYVAVLNGMVRSDYLSTIQKSSYNEWLTSYFAYDQITSSDKIKALCKVWDLPVDLFGLEFEVIKLDYSGNDSSLSDTELKLKFRITDKYNSSNTYTSNDFIVSGFFSPWDSATQAILNKSENYELNSGTISAYYNVPSYLRMGDGNAQNLPTDYWLKEPYSFYIKGKNDSSNQAKWVEYGKTSSANAISSLLSLENTLVTLADVKYIWKGDKRYGNYNSQGTCPAPISLKLRFSSKIYDQHGNSATKKYSDKTTNFLTLWIYFKNNYWGG